MPAHDEGEDFLGVWARDTGTRRTGEVAERDTQGDGDLVQAVDRDRLFTALHLADEFATEGRQAPQASLAETSLLAQFSHTLTEELPDVRHGSFAADRFLASFRPGHSARSSC